jgi:hypothetical protein
MSLTDIVSGLRATVWPIAALIIFATLFLVILVRTFVLTPRKDHDDASRIPLSDDEPVTPRTPNPPDDRIDP